MFAPRPSHSDESRVDASPIHQLIVDLRFPIIYTTNYDRWLEIAHRRRGAPYRKIAGVRDLPGADRSETQIIKFHGDFDHDESLVLTEAHFFDRMDFESRSTSSCERTLSARRSCSSATRSLT